jgi:hypothetical protein
MHEKHSWPLPTTDEEVFQLLNNNSFLNYTTQNTINAMWGIYKIKRIKLDVPIAFVTMLDRVIAIWNKTEV